MRLTPNRSAIACLALLTPLAALAPSFVYAQAPSSQPASEVSATAAARPAAETLVDWPIFPAVALPPTEFIDEFHPRLTEFWAAALDRPEMESRRMAISAILEASRRGMKGLESFHKRLTAMLSEKEMPTALRQAVVRALDQLEARESAPVLMQCNEAEGLEMILMTDPPLARWGHAPALEAWRKRIDDPATPAPIVTSAINALGSARDLPSAPRLAAIVKDSAQPGPRRLAAARALVAIAPPDLELLAQNLLITPPGKPAIAGSAVERILGVTLLRGNRSPSTRQTLLRIAFDPEPVIAAEALRQLYAIDPRLIEPLTPTLVKNPDATVRRIAVDVLTDNPTPASIATLTALLDDPIPSLRYRLRDHFIAVASRPALAEPVRKGVQSALTGDGNWRALEQAVQIAGKLDYKFNAPRLIALADHERAEVRLSALTALRWLAVPETYPVLAKMAAARREELKKVATTPAAPRKTEALSRFKVVPDPVGTRLASRDGEISQIYMALGVADYKPIEPILREYLPKAASKSEATLSRAVAFWSIGFLIHDTSDKALIALLDQRARDDAEIDGESPTVRQAAVQSLARMGAVDVVRKLGKDKADLAEIANLALNPGKQPPMPSVNALKQLHIFGFIEPLEAAPR